MDGLEFQKFVMEQFSDKTIILVADGEDTPREIYRRQNYQYYRFKYHVHIHKVYIPQILLRIGDFFVCPIKFMGLFFQNLTIAKHSNIE